MKNKKQDRLQEVYRHLLGTGEIKSTLDFANRLGRKRPGISAALNGNDLYLTDSLFRQIDEKFPNTFNLQYLLRGEGELLLNEPSSLASESPLSHIPIWADTLIGILSKQIKENETLNAELRTSIQEVSTLRNDLRTLLNTLTHSRNP